MNKFYRIINNEILQRCILVLLTIIICLCFVYANKYISVHSDPSYYLGVSYLIMDGKIPFVDFKLDYAPLSFYLMCILFLIFGKTYTYAITVLYVIHSINAFLVFKILRKQNISFNWAWFGGILFFMYCFVMEGFLYVLEPFVLLFGLLSLIFVQKKQSGYYILAGLLCAGSFLCKQYGLGFLFLNLSFVIVQNHYSKQGIKDSAYIILGFLLGLSIFIILMVSQGVSLRQMVDLSGSDYKKNGLHGFLAAWFFKVIAPIYLALSAALWHYKKVLKDGFWVVSICGLAGFMLPCFVRLYIHYLLLPLPFIIFIIIYIIPHISKPHFKTLYICFLFIITLVTTFKILKSTNWIITNNLRAEQELLSLKVSKYIPKSETNVFSSLRALPISLINTYEPPLLKKYGMSNGFVERAEGVEDLIKNADYAIINEQDMISPYQFYTPQVKEYLKTKFKSIIIHEKHDKYFVYIRK